jgi:phenylacetate-CoA ligase
MRAGNGVVLINDQVERLVRPAGQLDWEPLDVVTSLSRMLAVPSSALAALGAPQGTADEFLAAMDELTGSALQYPFRPREWAPETIIAHPVGKIALTGGRAALAQALFVGWFVGADVTIVDADDAPWHRLGQALAESGLRLPALRIAASAEAVDPAATAVAVGTEPTRWTDLAHTAWAPVLFRTEVRPGTLSQHRCTPATGAGARRRLDARWRLLVDRARHDPDLIPARPGVFTGDPATLEPQTKAHLEQYTGPQPADGQVLRSGATTGAPRFITYTASDWRRMVFEAMPMLYAAGVEPGDGIVNTLIGGSLYGGLTTSLCELSRMGVLNFTTAQHITPEALVDLTGRFGITMVMGQPALLLPLLRDAHRIDPSFRLPKVIFGGTSLADHDRNWLAETLGTHQISSILAANDGAQIAYQCSHQRGRTHHLIDDYNYVEIVRPDGTAAEPGEPGEILLTTLQKLHTPLIRYRIGDLGSVGWTDCACGVSGRTLDYLGRTDGLIKVKGRTVTHAEIDAELRRFEVSQLQVVIDTVGGTERATVLAETATRPDPAAVRSHLAQRFEALSDRHAFGEGRDVFRFELQMLPPGAIKRDPVSGKVRPVVDHRIAADAHAQQRGQEG